MSEYDVIIVGAGPAGSCLARLLADLPGLSVALLDARSLDRPYAGSGRIKSCGGLAAPDAQKALALMDMTLPSRLLVTPQLFSVRTVDVPARLTRSYQRFYLNMDREAFDRWLFEEALTAGARHGGRLHARTGVTVLGIVPDAGGHVLTCSDHSRLRARFVVGADGANSVVRRKLFPPLAVRRYISIQERFNGQDFAPHFAAFFDPHITDYYGWGLPKNNEYLLGVAIPEGSGAAKAFERFKERLRPFGYRLDAALRRETTLLLRPDSLPGPGVRPDGTACLLGEAGGYVSPSSAEGFSYAFRTAMILYRSLSLTGLPPASGQYFREAMHIHKRLMWPLRAQLACKILKSQVLYRPLARRLVMRSGVDSLAPLKSSVE